MFVLSGENAGSNLIAGSARSDSWVVFVVEDASSGPVEDGRRTGGGNALPL